MNKPVVSIIIRTRNEERWISSCLDSVFDQDYSRFEVIIVDNDSTDKTIAKARNYPVNEILNIKDYLPGKALNLGVEHSRGEYVVCLSAHCIPVNSDWLSKLVYSLEEDTSYAGVYGRQEPMSFSTLSDKRDMLLVFSLDRKLQIKDSFFHNANSIIRRNCWDQVPFDDKITNIEDRIWAQEMLNLGYRLLYEPEASVYHYHGIHQNGDSERLSNVVTIIEEQNNSLVSGRLDADKLKIVAIIPVRGTTKSHKSKPLLVYTIESALKSKYINNIIVSTDSIRTAEIAENAGAVCPFLRPRSLSGPLVNHQTVQKFSLDKIEELGCLPDLVVHLEETFPFRPSGMLDGMIARLLKDGYDSVIAARREVGWFWQESVDGAYKRIDSGDVPRDFKEKFLVGLHGLGCVSHPEFIRNGQMLGNRVGLYEVDNPLVGIEVRSDASIVQFSNILDDFEY